jgi:hypothetical protein
MLEINKVATPPTPGIDGTAPKWIKGVAWFIRITAVLILLTSTAGIIQAGWLHSLRGGSVAGLFNGTPLFVMSFRYVTTGKTRRILSAVTIVLAVGVMVFSLAMLGLPHL